MTIHLEKLFKLTNINEIYSYLNQSIDFFETATNKGLILELYLTELMKKKGINAVHTGGANDNGIDIQIFDKTSTPIRYVQVKNHNKRISVDDINSELSKSIKVAQGALEIFSLNGFTEEAIREKAGYITLFSKQYIVELLEMEDKTSEEGPSPLNRLYDYNIQTYHNILNLLEDNDKACAVQPTGTGKMYLMEALAIKYINEGKKVLIVAPSIEILNQMRNMSSYIYSSSLIHYSTYAGLHNIIHEDFSLILLDEFHRLEADSWRSKVDVLIDSNFESKVVGFSATPIREDGKDVREFFDNNIARNMDLMEAIYLGLLKAPTFITSLYSIKEDVFKIKDKVEKSDLSEEDKGVKLSELKKIETDWEQTSGIVKIIQKYISENIKKGIVFYKNKEHMDKFSPTVHKWFVDSRIHKISNIHAFEVNSDYSNKINRETIDDFKSRSKGLNLLHCVDMLNEGLHVEDLELAVFLRDTKSKIIFYQQLGRVLSASSDHSSIVLDLVGNIDNIGSNSFQDALNEARERVEYNRGINGLVSTGKEVCFLHVIDLTVDLVERFKEVNSTLLVDIHIQIKYFVDWIIENGIENLKYNKKLVAWKYYFKHKYSKNNFIITEQEKILLESVDKDFFKFIGRVNKKERIDIIVDFYHKFNDYPKTHLNRIENESAIAKWMLEIRNGKTKISKEDEKKLISINFSLNKERVRLNLDDFLIELKNFISLYKYFPKDNRGGLKESCHEKELSIRLSLIISRILNRNYLNNSTLQKYLIRLKALDEKYFNNNLMKAYKNNIRKKLTEKQTDHKLYVKEYNWFLNQLRTSGYYGELLLKKFIKEGILPEYAIKYKEVFDAIGGKLSFYSFLTLQEIIEFYNNYGRSEQISENPKTYRYLIQIYSDKNKEKYLNETEYLKKIGFKLNLFINKKESVFAKDFKLLDSIYNIFKNGLNINDFKEEFELYTYLMSSKTLKEKEAYFKKILIHNKVIF